jgi:hypothetical protein
VCWEPGRGWVARWERATPPPPAAPPSWFSPPVVISWAFLLEVLFLLWWMIRLGLYATALIRKSRRLLSELPSTRSWSCAVRPDTNTLIVLPPLASAARPTPKV